MKTATNTRLTKLWFDVERGYQTISTNAEQAATELWFDVERGYQTI